MTDLEMDLLIAKARVSSLERIIAKQQKQAAAGKCGFGDGVTIKPDGIHFNSASYRELGHRYAKAYLNMSKK